MPEQIMTEPRTIDELMPREETGQELIERLVAAYKADCGNTLRLELFKWHDGCHINIRCEDDCPERRGYGKGDTFHEALLMAIESAGTR